MAAASTGGPEMRVGPGARHHHRGAGERRVQLPRVQRSDPGLHAKLEQCVGTAPHSHHGNACRGSPFDGAAARRSGRAVNDERHICLMSSVVGHTVRRMRHSL